MRTALLTAILTLLCPPAGAATMACFEGPACGLAEWISYPTQITLANDEGTEVWIGHYSGHQILRFDPINCLRLGWADLPGGPGGVSGLARDGDALWYVIHAEGRIFKLDTTTWSLITSFPSPAQSGGGDAGNGVAWDGQYLWHTDGPLNMIYKLDPETGAVVDSFQAPGEYAWGLEYRDGILYLGDHTGDRIYAIDSTTHEVLGSCDPPMSTPSQGVAARPDGRFWYLSGTFFEVYDLGIEWTTSATASSWGLVKSRY